MADEISIGSKAIKEVQDLRAELIKLSQDALNAGKTLSNISTPGGLNKAGGDNAKAGADLDAFKAKYISLNETIVKGAEKSRLAEIRLQQQREKAFDSFEKNAKKEEAALKKAEGAYQRYQNSVNAMTKTYNDLAIRKELGNTLSSKEEKQLATLSTRINQYQTALKTVDSQIGKNQRNVGNYASGYNALGNSINQLSREAPAFANSINTGFMALSNNFPALFDAISGIREQNKLLIAEGKPTTSLFKQLVSGIFSWQTALSLGVTLLTLYGGTIVKWISNLGKASDELSAVARAQQSLNKAQADADKGTSDEITHLQLLASTAQDLAVPMDARKRAVKEMQELYPHYLGNLSEEAILAGETSTQMAELAKNIMAAAVARGIEEEISKKAQADYKARKLLIGEINTDLQGYQKALKSFDKVTDQQQKEAYLLNVKVQFQQTRERKLAALKALTERQDAENEILVKGYKKQVELSGKLGPDGKDEADKKAARVKKEQREDIEGLENHLKIVGTLKDEIDAEISRLTTDRIVGSESVLPMINAQLEMLIKLRKQLFDVPTADVKILGDGPEIASRSLKQLSEETKNYLKTFVDEFASNAGLRNLIDSFDIDNEDSLFSKIKDGLAFTSDNWQASAVDIMESAQEMYNFISNASQGNFDAEKERLQAQYDIAVTFAGDSAAAKKKLDEDLEKRQKEIANREAKAKKQQAIYNIAIDTAQAVVAALPNFVLAGIVAAFGLAQALVVSSQEIPQYWMGGTHEGGLMMVNDGSGSNFKETVVTPDGNIHKPQGKNVIMDAPKGTQIFTHDQWQQSLNDMLKGNGISMSIPHQYNSSGITKDDMYDVLMDTLGSQPQYHSNFDADGAVTYILKGGNKTIINRNRGNGKGTKFSN